MTIPELIAKELSTKTQQVDAAIRLLDEGATIPFIARYRKELTGSLDDTQLRQLSQRLSYLRTLEERKKTILNSIDEQNKLTPELQQTIEQTDNKTLLEDLYLPYKPKRRTKAQIARENGLQPLANKLLKSTQSPDELALDYLDNEIKTVKTALDGARFILIEQFAEHPELIGALREKLWLEADIQATVVKKKAEVGEKFKDYFDHQEPLRNMPSHRALAILRGKNEGILKVTLRYQSDETSPRQQDDYEGLISKQFGIIDCNNSFWLKETVKQAWKTKIFTTLETELLGRLKDKSDRSAINVFANNLKDLLLSAPAGRLTTLGLDPGYRTGIKTAVVDDTGKVIATTVVYLHKEKAALNTLLNLIQEHNINLIAIGNGTASRETDKLAAQLIKAKKDLHKMVVSEAGASIYSASELASKEFPTLDVSLRGAVSIARRLQDPLAELVKIDPRSIGVGQYQHDVNQAQLAQALDATVEDCVNAVGVDVNTASVSLLSRVSGLNNTHAQNIVAFRDEKGAFENRKTLLKVPRLGAKTYEQAAGFLRIHGGKEPLDASAVHPEAYPIVTSMLVDNRIQAPDLIGNREKLSQIKPNDYVTEQFGLPTIRDILAELEKPGRDPRGVYQTPSFADEINEISDLEEGMILEGVVSNVANFGAFIDIGVHQDGLVHISKLSEKFVSDPREIVKTGDIVTVKVTEVEIKRKRIALSMRINHEEKNKIESQNSVKKKSHCDNHSSNSRPRAKQQITKQQTAMADAFAQLKKR